MSTLFLIAHKEVKLFCRVSYYCDLILTFYFRLEDLFYEYGVDVVLQAHEHSYERLWPMYKGIVLSKNYTNPAAPVQLVTGAAGSKHGVDQMNPKPGL